MRLAGRFTVGIVLTSVLAAPAWPQQAGTNETDSAIQEITVTARKREESLLQTPVAVTALTGSALEQRTIRRLDDVTDAVPNVSFTGGSSDKANPGTAVIFIRGIGQTDYANSIDPGVGVYVDGVYLGRTIGANLNLPDIAQVEVLRGPQGTLFGKNTMGGAINVTTKSPTFENDATISVTGGERGRFDVETLGDVAFLDDLAGDLVYVHRQSDGYIHRLSGGTLGEHDDNILRGKLEYQSGDFFAVLSADASKLDSTVGATFRDFDPLSVGDSLGYLWNNVPAFLLPNVLSRGAVPPNPALPKVPYSVVFGARLQPSDPGLYTNLDQGPSTDEYRSEGVSLRLEDRLGIGTLRSITAARGFANEQIFQQDGTPAPIVFSHSHDNQVQYSEELNYFGKSFDGDLDWLVGAYAYREIASTRSEEAVDYPIFHIDTLYETKSSSYAAFGEATWRFDPEWSLVVGMRYTHDSKDFHVAEPCYADIVAPFCVDGYYLPSISASRSWDSVDPRVSLQYRPADNVMLYATFSTGYKSGGFNARPPSPEAARTAYNPERLKSYEIGVKGAFLDRKLTLTAAGFHYDYSDLQFTVSGVDQRGLTTAVNGNLGDATINGGEIEGVLAATSQLRLDFAAGYTDAEYVRLDPALLAVLTTSGRGAVTLNSRLPKTPKWTANAGVQYTQPVPTGDVVGRVDVSYVDPQFSEVQNFAETESPAHLILNARVTYEPTDAPWRIAVYGRNLTDRRYVVNGFWPGGGANAIVELVPSEPREVGATVTYKF